MARERGIVERAITGVAGDVGRELVAEVGADLIRGGQDRRTSAAEPRISWWKSFLVGFLPTGVSLATFSAVKGRALENAGKGLAPEDLMDKVSAFDRFMEDARAREPWRVSLFKELIAATPDRSDQERIFLSVFNAEPNEWEDRLKSIAPEKPTMTRFGEWLKSKVPNWAEVQHKLGQGWEFTKRSGESADAYVGREIAPSVTNALDRFDEVVDDWARRHQNGL